MRGSDLEFDGINFFLIIILIKQVYIEVDYT